MDSAGPRPCLLRGCSSIICGSETDVFRHRPRYQKSHRKWRSAGVICPQPLVTGERCSATRPRRVGASAPFATIELPWNARDIAIATKGFVAGSLVAMALQNVSALTAAAKRGAFELTCAANNIRESAPHVVPQLAPPEPVRILIRRLVHPDQDSIRHTSESSTRPERAPALMPRADLLVFSLFSVGLSLSFTFLSPTRILSNGLTGQQLCGLQLRALLHARWHRR